jgi:hypothetical protein
MAIGTTAALLGSAAIGAGASIFGANKAADAQKAAARTQAKAFEEGKNLLLPYTKGSTEALTQYGNAVGVNGRDAQSRYYQDFQADPGFQTALNNSLDETMRRYSIVGRTGGGMANSLLKTGQNALMGAYDKRLSQLGGLVDTGRGAASSIASMGQQSAAGQASSLANAGMLQGGGIVNTGNALIGGLNNYTTMQQNAAGRLAGGNVGAGGWDTFTVNNRALF